MRYLLLLLAFVPLLLPATEICERVNAADLDVRKYGYDEASVADFEETVKNFLTIMVENQLHGEDGMADIAVQELAEKLEELVKEDENRLPPEDHVGFMRLINEFVIKTVHLNLSMLYVSLEHRYRKLLAMRITDYARLHKSRLENSPCSIDESIRALETLKTMDGIVTNFTYDLSEGDFSIAAEFHYVAEEFINKCAVKGLVKARLPYPQALCPSSGEQYIIPNPYFYQFDLSKTSTTEYLGRAVCKNLGGGMGLSAYTFVRNNAKARLILKKDLTLFLRTELQFEPDALVYSFLCKSALLPDKDFGKAELNNLAHSLSAEGEECVVTTVNQDATGGHLGMRSEGMPLGSFSATPGSPEPPDITMNPPTGEKPIFEGRQNTQIVNQPTTIEWECEEPYNLISMEGFEAPGGKPILKLEFQN